MELRMRDIKPTALNNNRVTSILLAIEDLRIVTVNQTRKVAVIFFKFSARPVSSALL